MEAEATFTVQQVVATAFMLYLCMLPYRPMSGAWIFQNRSSYCGP